MKVVESLRRKPPVLIADLLLTVATALIYFIHFPDVFIKPNSILSGITGDAFKNYFTYSFHINNDDSLVEFKGMNFPFGEHVVYTDCQPLLTWVLRLIPGAGVYCIGILHYLLFFSYILCPMVLRRILSRFIPHLASTSLIALAITLLSPQFQKIAGGHHGLAYGALIPLTIYFLLRALEDPRRKFLILLVTYNTSLFLIHPYMGFAASVFSTLSFLFYAVFNLQWNSLLQMCIAGIVPVLTFRLFMYLSDRHTNRTTEPFGKNTLRENIDALLAPDFGPMQAFMEKIFPHKIAHLESHSYLGFATIVLFLIFLVALPFVVRKVSLNRGLLAMLIASICLLFVSFGWHNKLLDRIGINSAGLNQFRAICRFAWTFYFMFPLALAVILSGVVLRMIPKYKPVLVTIALFWLGFNVWESHFYFNKDAQHFWKFRNVLNESLLNKDEEIILAKIKESNSQAILPLPVFHLGSETFARAGADNSMIPAMMYSYHSGLPIYGVAMSRTSITETIESLELLNSYKKERKILSLLSDKPFVIIRTRDSLMPDEERLILNFKATVKNDSFQLGMIPVSEILRPKTDHKIVYHDPAQETKLSEKGVVYFPTSDQRPFIETPLENYENIYKLDSNLVESGKYVFSYHYYPPRNADRFVPVSFIFAQQKGQEFQWLYDVPGRLISGFYGKYYVFEHFVFLEKKCGYSFIIKGGGEGSYHLRNFMLRPYDVTLVSNKGPSVVNNFPVD